MGSIKISKESLDAFKNGERIIPAPIDNKNLLEDPFEDEVFGDFYACCNHRKDGLRHLIGMKDEAFVEVCWRFGSNQIEILVVAVNPCEDFEETSKEIYEEYKKEFSSWQCEDNPGLVVKFSGEKERRLFVSFFFKDED